MLNETPETWAQRLDNARRQCASIAPLIETEPGITIADAYEVAVLTVGARTTGENPIVGHKIGLTSEVVQKQLGVDQPDYGSLLGDMAVENGASISRSDFLAPRVELEFAFLLSDDLVGPGVGVDDVSRATAAIQPSIELVDSRIADWRITLCDTIADNASSGAFVLGDTQSELGDAPIEADVRLFNNGALVAEGKPSAVMGDPRLAVAWLANAIGQFGGQLKAGDIVLSGACTPMFDAHPGDRFVGDFGDYGSVSLDIASAR